MNAKVMFLYFVLAHTKFFKIIAAKSDQHWA
jgi:hypothetical protein